MTCFNCKCLSRQTIFERAKKISRGMRADGRENAHDGVRNSGNLDLPAQDERVGIEISPPIAVAKNHDPAGRYRHFRIREAASHRGVSAKSGEKLRRYAHKRHAVCCAGFSHDCRSLAVDGEIREGWYLTAAFVVIGR